MKKQTLEDRIIKYLQECGTWVHAGVIERKAQEAGYMASTGTRKCRLLAESGILEVEYEKGQAQYRAKTKKKKQKVEIKNNVAYITYV